MHRPQWTILSQDAVREANYNVISSESSYPEHLENHRIKDWIKGGKLELIQRDQDEECGECLVGPQGAAVSERTVSCCEIIFLITVAVDSEISPFSVHTKAHQVAYTSVRAVSICICMVRIHFQ